MKSFSYVWESPKPSIKQDGQCVPTSQALWEEVFYRGAPAAEGPVYQRTEIMQTEDELLSRWPKMAAGIVGVGKTAGLLSESAGK